MKRKAQAEKTHIISCNVAKMGQVFFERETPECDHFTKDKAKAKTFSLFDTHALTERLRRSSGISGVKTEEVSSGDG